MAPHPRLRDARGRGEGEGEGEGKITLWIGSSTDIDDMMQAQEELMDAEAQLADRAVQLQGIVAERTAELTSAHAKLVEEADERRRLEAEVTGAIESERERLGQELHDGVVQELTGITMMLQALTKTLMKSAPAQAKGAERLCRMLETAHGNARDLAKCFYPVELEQHGLFMALEGIAQRTQQQYGISCVAETDSPEAPDAPVVKDVISVQLYRIAQEAVQNAVKHSHAKTIIIRLSKRKRSLRLTVRDDGIGLPTGGSESEGMGLRIMQYRARIMNGTLLVENAEGGGATVSCTVAIGAKR